MCACGHLTRVWFLRPLLLLLLLLPLLLFIQPALLLKSPPNGRELPDSRPCGVLPP